MHPASSDEVIRHILQAIVQRVNQVKKTKSSSSETLAAYLVRATVLNPSHGFQVDSVFTKQDVDRLIELCTQKLVQLNDPESETVQMQVYFDTTFPLQADYLHQEKQMRKNTVANVLREITGTRTVKTLPQLEWLYRNMVSYVLLKSGMGSSSLSDGIAAREATVALESVFPQSEVSTFLALGWADQERQLNGLTQLVGGIRLFNYHLNKASKDQLDNLPELCAKEIKDAFQIIEERNKYIHEKLTALVHVARAPQTTPQTNPVSSVGRVLDAIIFYRQLLIYMDALKAQIQKSSSVLSTLDEKMTEQLNLLQSACKSRMAVPVDQVYPLFMTLYSIWEAFQDELFLNAFRRGVLDRLCLHADSFEIHVDPSSSIGHPEEEKKKTTEEIIQQAMVLQDTLTLMKKGSLMEVLHPGNTSQYYQLPLEFSGFCPITLTHHAGLVVPGNWNIGALKYKDKVYLCASMEAAKAFVSAPEETISKVILLAREKMGLVQLLQLYGYFPSIQALENAHSFTRDMLLSKTPLVCESSTQCDVHIIDPYFDPKYEWNEWTMRKKALMLVNLRKKKTHGCQTQVSHFKRDNCSQIYLPKVKSVQTKSHQSIGMAKPSMAYIPALLTSQPK
ncbi:hypothetical protein HMI56_003927 [Coelomomyces lativittatus]|nr:hypothetical protein HMI56_003927 [Coelomomyces lativittatus]